MAYSIIKNMFRARLSTSRDESGQINIDPFNMNGILVEVVFLAGGIIFYGGMVIILEVRANRTREP